MSLKVLIVDDLKSFLDFEASFLRRAECRVFTAPNGLEALRIAKNEMPDIIFLDLEMPVMNGIECCRFIKSDMLLKDTPVIIVTASSREEDCYKAGCSSYLRKPIDEDIFFSEIKKFVPIKERSDPRIDVSIPVNINFKGTLTPGLTENLSRFGILLLTREPFTVGSTIGLEFSLPEVKGKIKAKALIVREAKTNSGQRGLGLRFFEIADRHQAVIDSFIAEGLSS